jgi:hypothetical protein
MSRIIQQVFLETRSGTAVVAALVALPRLRLVQSSSVLDEGIDSLVHFVSARTVVLQLRLASAVDGSCDPSTIGGSEPHVPVVSPEMPLETGCVEGPHVAGITEVLSAFVFFSEMGDELVDGREGVFAWRARVTRASRHAAGVIADGLCGTQLIRACILVRGMFDATTFFRNCSGGGD